MDGFLVMDLMVAGVGIWIAVSAVQMKRSGKVSGTIVPEEEVKKCKDPEKYIAGIVPYLYVFSAFLFLAGVIGILCDLRVLSFGMPWRYGELALFLFVLAVCVHRLNTMKSKYF